MTKEEIFKELYFAKKGVDLQLTRKDGIWNTGNYITHDNIQLKFSLQNTNDPLYNDFDGKETTLGIDDIEKISLFQTP